MNKKIEEWLIVKYLEKTLNFESKMSVEKQIKITFEDQDRDNFMTNQEFDLYVDDKFDLSDEELEKRKKSVLDYFNVTEKKQKINEYSHENIKNFFLENREEIKGNSYFNIKIAGIGEKALMIIINNDNHNKEFYKYEDIEKDISQYQKEDFSEFYRPSFFKRIIISKFTDLKINLEDVENQDTQKKNKELEAFERIANSKSSEELRTLRDMITNTLNARYSNDKNIHSDQDNNMNKSYSEELDFNNFFKEYVLKNEFINEFKATDDEYKNKVKLVLETKNHDVREQDKKDLELYAIVNAAAKFIANKYQNFDDHKIILKRYQDNKEMMRKAIKNRYDIVKTENRDCYLLVKVEFGKENKLRIMFSKMV